IELVRVGFPAENRSAIVAQRHLRDISTLVVLVFFFACQRPGDGIGSVLNAVPLDPVGGDFNELSWSLDRLSVLDLDPGSLRLYSADGTDKSILFFSAIEDGNCRTRRSRNTVLRTNRRGENQHGPQ